MSRKQVAAVAAAALAAAWWRARGTSPSPSGTSPRLRGRDRLPKGVRTYDSPVVDRRGAGAAAVHPLRAETPAEVVAEFYDEHRTP